jgi:hypothetical protein
MAFSDCVYLAMNNTFHAALLASRMMRYLIETGIPVRMGMARGTFQGNAFAVTVKDAIVTKALFGGTGIVYAHMAETCGEKGCRIFVHPSLRPEDFMFMMTGIPLLELPSPTPRAYAEVCYLGPEYGERPDFVGRSLRPANADLALWEGVRFMETASEPLSDKDRLHYSETKDAIQRMRELFGRNSSLGDVAAKERLGIVPRAKSEGGRTISPEDEHR